jgi:hypothetical protein
MKRILIILCVSFIARIAIAQEDTSRNVTIKQGGDTTATRFRNENVIVMSNEDLPAELRTTLSSDERYKGWENQKIYLDKTNKVYLMEVKDGVTTKVYRFDAKGKPVSGSKPPHE